MFETEWSSWGWSFRTSQAPFFAAGWGWAAEQSAGQQPRNSPSLSGCAFTLLWITCCTTFLVHNFKKPPLGKWVCLNLTMFFLPNQIPEPFVVCCSKLKIYYDFPAEKKYSRFTLDALRWRATDKIRNSWQMKTRNSVKKRNCNVFLARRTSAPPINPVRVLNIHFTADPARKEMFKCWKPAYGKF